MHDREGDDDGDDGSSSRSSKKGHGVSDNVTPDADALLSSLRPVGNVITRLDVDGEAGCDASRDEGGRNSASSVSSQGHLRTEIIVTMMGDLPMAPPFASAPSVPTTMRDDDADYEDDDGNEYEHD